MRERTAKGLFSIILGSEGSEESWRRSGTTVLALYDSELQSWVLEKPVEPHGRGSTELNEAPPRLDCNSSADVGKENSSDSKRLRGEQRNTATAPLASCHHDDHLADINLPSSLLLLPRMTRRADAERATIGRMQVENETKRSGGTWAVPMVSRQSDHGQHYPSATPPTQTTEESALTPNFQTSRHLRPLVRSSLPFLCAKLSPSTCLSCMCEVA
ncbi:hypothetical protein B0H14DRAFT_1391799 [Mycena olivaceomarginata]|nr:hypothetical protein B0H14DRAFT_1391799 [Mycena olivaceomarginata]